MKPQAAAVEEPIAEAAGVWCMRLSEGPLSPEHRSELEAWLTVSETHRQALEEAVATWRELDGAESGTEFLNLRLEALNAVRRAKQRRRWAVERHWRAIAASVLLTIGVGGGLVWRGISPTVYETGLGERHVILLADGSRVSLDADTRLEVRYSGRARSLRLDRGRAKFDVAKDPTRPFSVEAGDKTVVATGTEFSVELVHSQVQVILYQGHVAVLSGGGGSSTKRPLRLASAPTAPADAALTPGRELIARADAVTATVVQADPGRTLSWEAGQLDFVNEPLVSAIERVNRYSETKLAIGDPAAGGISITGVFTAGDAQAFIDGVTAVFPVHAESEGGNIVFYSHGLRKSQ